MLKNKTYEIKMTLFILSFDAYVIFPSGMCFIYAYTKRALKYFFTQN